MRWRRFKVFAALWGRLFAWGQSRPKKVVTLLGMVLTAIGLHAVLDSNLSINLLLNETPTHILDVRVGTLIAGVLLLAWALITGALAWERSGVPILIVADNLEWDGIRYRLRLESKDKPYDTSVRLLEIVTESGRNMVPRPRVNLDLEWTHYGGQSNIHIKADEAEYVSVATIREEGSRVLLRFTGANHQENLLVLDRAYFHLRIAYKPKPIERWFCFRQNGKSFDVTNEQPPTQLQS